MANGRVYRGQVIMDGQRVGTVVTTVSRGRGLNHNRPETVSLPSAGEITAQQENRPPRPSAPMPSGLVENEHKADAARASAKLVQEIARADAERAAERAQAAEAAAAARRKGADAAKLQEEAEAAKEKAREARKAHLDAQAHALFDAKAGPIMTRLKQDFPQLFPTKEHAAALLGSLGVESAGFRKMQEKLTAEKIAKGWRGGLGWTQATASRRDEFEAFLKQHNQTPESFAGNYGNLHRELSQRHYQKPLMHGMKDTEPFVAAPTLDRKVKAFEQVFERADPDSKHYDRRQAYAERAMKAPSAYDPPAP